MKNYHWIKNSDNFGTLFPLQIYALARITTVSSFLFSSEQVAYGTGDKYTLYTEFTQVWHIYVCTCIYTYTYICIHFSLFCWINTLIFSPVELLALFARYYSFMCVNSACGIYIFSFSLSPFLSLFLSCICVYICMYIYLFKSQISL